MKTFYKIDISKYTFVIFYVQFFFCTFSINLRSIRIIEKIVNYESKIFHWKFLAKKHENKSELKPFFIIELHECTEPKGRWWIATKLAILLLFLHNQILFEVNEMNLILDLRVRASLYEGKYQHNEARSFLLIEVLSHVQKHRP